LRDGGHIGYGAIIWGSNDERLWGFSKYIGIGSAYLAELWGVLEGLMYVRQLQFRFIELHIDSLVVVQTITSNGHTSWRGRFLLIGKLSFITPNVANRSANVLANYGCSMDAGISFFNVFPSSIKQLLLFEKVGNTTPRIVSL
jgi:hypothetical protein